MKRVMLVLAVCALALTIPLSAIAGNGPSNKVTGTMSHLNGIYGLAQFTFSGHDLGLAGTDKGTASYSDMAGSWSGTTTDVSVIGTTAVMTVVVASSTHPAVPVGSTHTYTFTDGGEGTSGEGDSFVYSGYDHVFTAESGNIQIHYSTPS